MCHKLKQLEFESEKNIGIQKHAGKKRKFTFFCIGSKASKKDDKVEFNGLS